ncbi:MAG: TonB-dependent receptor [Bacteroidales bacterium]|nr:TonB-dependent receptor [Bacteroidales bacterium]
MIKKITLVVSFLSKLKLATKLITMLLLFGTIQSFAATGMFDDGIVSASDLQQKRVTGRVSDAAGSALAGVNIMEKGTINGAISDQNGNYAITVASANSILSFSFIGYTTQEITIGAQNTVNIVLAEAVSALDEIVVVGYSTQQRKSLTGSVSTVNAAALSESAATNPISRLQGKVAGVTILNQHTPGEGSTIRIRGMTTINDASPLYVVDGVPGGSYSPNDVETITILKDAAAQSIYGARAANGVVLITTKSGKKNQKISMNVNVRQGISRNTNFYDLLNTQEWGEMVWLERKNAWQQAYDAWVLAGSVGTAPVLTYSNSQYGTGTTPVIPDYIVPARTFEGDPLTDPSLYDNQLAVRDGDDTYLITRTNKEGTDWMKEAQQTGSFKEYTIDVAGGSQNTTYAFLLGYTSDEGVYKWTGYERYSFRTNINSSPAKWIDLGTNLGLQYTDDHGHQGDNSESSMTSWCYRLPPMIPVFDISGTTYAGSRASGMGNAQNPVSLLDKNQYNGTQQMTVSGNAFVKFNILKGLSVKTLIGINQYGYQSRSFGFVEVAAAERGTYDSYSKSAGFGLNWTWTNTIEYSLVTGQHNFKAIAGSEAYDNNSTSISGSRSEYPFLDINYMTLNTGLRSIANSDGNSAYSLYSLFGRLNYTFADKYMVEGVVRRDGSSRFGTEKYGIFPAFSLGWRISEESFMASTKSWLNELKLRAGYGAVGNDRMGNYNSYTQFVYSEGGASYGMSGSNSSLSTVGFYQSTFGNTDVKWETTTTTNIGIDATLIKNLTLTFDVWQRSTKDMLYPKQLPLVLGTASRPSINIGEMKNTGFDLELGYSDNALNGDLTYSAGLVLSRYKNELVKLTDVATDFYQGSSYREKPYTRTVTGRAFPEFFGYIVEGIFMDQAEVDAWPKAFGATGTYNKPGHFKYKDVDGNGYIDAADRTYIGSPHPDFTAGLSLSVAYKGLSLSTTLYTTVGNEVVNYVSRFIDYTQFESGKSNRRLYESWGSPYLSDNSQATMPVILANDTPHQEPSTAFLEDGSFLRMKTLRIGYDFNKLLKNKFNTLQLYFQGSNLFTLTKYPGLDPEISTGGINMGIDSGAWPTAQQFMFGISFGI